jgi:hypothetical protein
MNDDPTDTEHHNDHDTEHHNEHDEATGDSSSASRRRVRRTGAA